MKYVNGWLMLTLQVMGYKIECEYDLDNKHAELTVDGVTVADSLECADDPAAWYVAVIENVLRMNWVGEYGIRPKDIKKINEMSELIKKYTSKPEPVTRYAFDEDWLYGMAGVAKTATMEDYYHAIKTVEAIFNAKD